MTHAFKIKVLFRGDWCPWCNAYLQDFNDALDTVTSLGDEIVAITSQAGNQSAVKNGLNFDAIIDEANSEARKYGIAITPKAESPLKDAEGVYPNGMVQPCVVIEDMGG